MIKSVYLDNAAATPLSEPVKQYLISILDLYGNPSSFHSVGQPVKEVIAKARKSVAEFIHADENEIYFVPSGSAGNTLAIKGLTSDNPRENQYKVFCSPTAHKSMLKVCESCKHHTALAVNSQGEIALPYLENLLTRHSVRKPLVCIEAANSEIGTIHDVTAIGSIVHKHNGILVIDATGYLPAFQINMKKWKNTVDILIFSGHKLHSLKGIGVLWKKKNIELKPLIYGSQQDGIAAGTENVLGIASLGKAVENYDYSSISPSNRDYVYDYIMQNIPESYLAGASVESGNRLPNNLYICFKGIEGESLMLLLDINGIQVGTGSACTSGALSASAALSAIGMDKEYIHSCIRMTFSGQETMEELDYVCETLKQCVQKLRNFI